MQRLRSMAFAVFLYASGLILGIIALPALLLGENAARAIAKIWARIVIAVLKTLTGVTFRLEGENFLPKEGALVASNHQSMWETIALYMLLPKPVMVFKKELARVPIYGWFASRAGNIAVDRKGGPKALRAMRQQSAQRIADGYQVIVFPEGTRVPPGNTGKFHPGIAGIYAAADAPCTPIAHNSGLFWRYPGMNKKPGEISVKILPPIEAGLERKIFLTLLKDKIDGARPDLVGNQPECFSDD